MWREWGGGGVHVWLGEGGRQHNFDSLFILHSDLALTFHCHGGEGGGGGGGGGGYQLDSDRN